MDPRLNGPRLWRAMVLLITCAMVQAQTAEVHLHSTAITESGSSLARGTCPVMIGNGRFVASTQGASSEPVAMYMLLSYLTAPTPSFLNTPCIHLVQQRGNIDCQPITEKGE